MVLVKSRLNNRYIIFILSFVKFILWYILTKEHVLLVLAQACVSRLIAWAYPTYLVHPLHIPTVEMPEYWAIAGHSL